eukprot:scaffold68005_cov66-Phaeocystis_antarctica.AAC.3
MLPRRSCRRASPMCTHTQEQHDLRHWQSRRAHRPPRLHGRAFRWQPLLCPASECPSSTRLQRPHLAPEVNRRLVTRGQAPPSENYRRRHAYSAGRGRHARADVVGRASVHPAPA